MEASLAAQLDPIIVEEVKRRANQALNDPSRVATTRHRILRTVSLLGHPTDGLNDTVRVGDMPSFGRCADDPDYVELEDPLERFAYMIDRMDGWRARKHMQRKMYGGISQLIKSPPPLRQPQQIRHRRGAIFHADDLLPLLADASDFEMFAHVEVGRYEMIRQVSLRMYNTTYELLVFPVQEVCSVLPSVMEAWHKEQEERRRPSVKYDDRHFHGHPKSHRGRVPTSV
jgi:hypothetical protein